MRPSRVAERKVYNSKYYAANKDVMRNNRRRNRGLPVVDALPAEACQCCGLMQPDRALCLDHCHATGEFRGWLCQKCNSGVGLLGDNLEGLLKAVRYLERFVATKETTIG